MRKLFVLLSALMVVALMLSACAGAAPAAEAPAAEPPAAEPAAADAPAAEPTPVVNAFGHATTRCALARSDAASDGAVFSEMLAAVRRGQPRYLP